MSKDNRVILSTDCVLVFDGKVLMTKRVIDPFKNHWVLPGGHVEYGERVEEALRREVMEETAISLDGNFKIIDVYSEPDRDPRGRTVSCAYFIKVSDIGDINLNEEANEFKFFDFNDLPESIGFDHESMIEDAYNKFLRQI